MQGRQMSEAVEFEWGTPVLVCLKYADGKRITTTGGRTRFLFTLTDGRVMFHDEPEAERMKQFGAGVPFYIQRNRGQGKGAPAIWNMWQGNVPTRQTEQQLDPGASQLERDLARSIDHVNTTRSGHGELAVPTETGAGRGASQPQPAPAAPASVTARKPASTAAVNGSVPREQGVILQACALVDAMAAVMNHAAQYGQVISREDVRSLVVTSFINLSGGRPGRNAA